MKTIWQMFLLAGSSASLALSGCDGDREEESNPSAVPGPSVPAPGPTPEEVPAAPSTSASESAGGTRADYQPSTGPGGANEENASE